MKATRSSVPQRSSLLLSQAYTLKAPAIAGAFYFFNQLTIGLKQPSIPGTIVFRKVALMSYAAGINQQ